MTKAELESLLSCIIRTEHKTTACIFQSEYQAIVRLCREVEAPEFVVEYFERKAIE